MKFWRKSIRKEKVLWVKKPKIWTKRRWGEKRNPKPVWRKAKIARLSNPPFRCLKPRKNPKATGRGKDYLRVCRLLNRGGIRAPITRGNLWGAATRVKDSLPRLL